MKKLMIVAMAALWGTVGFADVESSNVVGYNTLNDGNSSVMLGASFSNVNGGADGCTLGSIQGVFEEGDEIQVAYIDDDGIIQFTTYQYLTITGSGMDTDGWYDGDYELAGGTLIPRGSAVWFVSYSGSAKDMITSGEVSKSATTHPAFVEASNMICSAYPTPFNPNADTVAWSGLNDGDEIQVAYVDGDGIIQFTTYQYLTIKGSGMDVDGWYDGDYGLISSPITAIGQGFWLVLSNPSNVTMVEASPLAK